MGISICGCDLFTLRVEEAHSFADPNPNFQEIALEVFWLIEKIGEARSLACQFSEAVATPPSPQVTTIATITTIKIKLISIFITITTPIMITITITIIISNTIFMIMVARCSSMISVAAATYVAVLDVRSRASCVKNESHRPCHSLLRPMRPSMRKICGRPSSTVASCRKCSFCVCFHSLVTGCDQTSARPSMILRRVTRLLQKSCFLLQLWVVSMVILGFDYTWTYDGRASVPFPLQGIWAGGKVEHVRKTGARGPDFLGQKALPDHHHREPWQEQLRRLLFGSCCPTPLCCF